MSKHTSDQDPTFLSQSYRCYRAAFEHLLSDSAIQDCADIGVESKDIRRFQEIYRSSGYLCSFPGCRRGFLGFPSASDRNNHESFHSPQFRCVELDCDFSKIGFNSRQALRKHRLKYHTSVNEVPLPRFGHRRPIAKRDDHHGHGARIRTVRRYDSDSESDTIVEVPARRDAGTRLAWDLESSPEPSRESSEEPQPKRRGRKPGPQKRKAEERKRGRQSKTNDMLSSSDRSTLQRALKTVYDALMGLEVEDSDDTEDSAPESDDGPPTRLVIGPFAELPSKKDYPDYYLIITQPIAMAQIENKINKHQYQNLKELGQDVTLLATNARTYNEDGSLLYQDANAIQVRPPTKRIS